ncbi:hypothetical protein BGZ63DRAFT_419436 [Mariannaea sp. PMI_226]|nr:hypothetical protein BGZ63DRAFT_419436 [Mariannaea sp. PMI_226]
MPDPLTPISGSALKRWEIREGKSTRVYQSIRPHNVFTLTIEGERSVDSKTGTLIFLIHLGSRQLVSIRLHDLLKNYGTSTDMINIDKEIYEIYIGIPGQRRVIVVQLEDMRDFNVAVYMFKKSNLPVNDAIPHPVSSPTRTFSPHIPLDLQMASHFGPRLSSFTPFPHNSASSMLPSLGYDTPASYADLLNSSISAPNSLPESRSQNLQRLSSLPTYASVSLDSQFASDTLTQHLNPYNKFLGQGSSQTHAPRIGSPLKRSFNPQEPVSKLSVSDTESDLYLDATGLLNNTRGSSLPLAGSRHPSDHPFLTDNHQILKTDEREQYQYATILSQAFDTQFGIESRQKDMARSFRDSMPLPRKLPFESGASKTTSSSIFANKSEMETAIQAPELAQAAETAASALDKVSVSRSATPSSPILAQPVSRASTKQTSTELPVSKSTQQPPKQISTKTRKRTKNQPSTRTAVRKFPTKLPAGASATNKKRATANVTTRSASRETGELGARKTSGPASGGIRLVDKSATMTANEASPVDQRDLKSPVNRNAPVNLAANSSEDLSLPHNLIENDWRAVHTTVDHNLTVLVTDPGTLKDLNELTSKYFEQYVTDLENGSDKKFTAQFYMNCIMNVRREFWLKKLEEVGFAQSLEAS